MKYDTTPLEGGGWPLWSVSLTTYGERASGPCTRRKLQTLVEFFGLTDKGARQ